MQKIERSKTEEISNNEDELSELETEESLTKAASFFETRLGVSLLIVFFAGAFIFGNHFYLATQETGEASSFDPGLLQTIPVKSLPLKKIPLRRSQYKLSMFRKKYTVSGLKIRSGHRNGTSHFLAHIQNLSLLFSKQKVLS